MQVGTGGKQFEGFPTPGAVFPCLRSCPVPIPSLPALRTRMQVAAALCASYIGGSVNFAAVSQALSLAPGPLLAGAMTADNIAMAVYIAVIMSIPTGAPKQATSAAAAKQPGSVATGRSDVLSSSSSSSGKSEGEAIPSEDGPPSLVAPPLTAETASLSLAAAAAACMLGNVIAGAVGFGSGALAVMALLASGAAMLGAAIAKRHGTSGAVSPFAGGLLPGQHLALCFCPAVAWGGQEQGESCCGQAVCRLPCCWHTAILCYVSAPSSVLLRASECTAGAEALGSALMMLFFATIGAGAGSLQALSGCWWLLAFIAVQLGVHLAVCIGGGRLLRLPMRAILIASNANVGGSATAAAFATAKGWQEMVQVRGWGVGLD